jgi:hypothetical protein
MDRYWNLRQEFYQALHRWPVMVAFFVVGCALGWLVSFVWPSYGKATQEVYVGLNPYRAYSDANFLALAKPRYSNLDNYNYWQMSQLDAAIYLDAMLKETLDNLRQAGFSTAKDAYWQNVDISQLRAMLDADWRTAGTWQLIAMNPDPKRAEQLVAAWSDVVLKNVEAAVTSARQLFIIDQERQATQTELIQSRQRQQQLSVVKDKLEAWQQEAWKLSPEQPFSAAERWRLFSLTGNLAQFTPAWMALMAEQPSTDGLPATYIEWVDHILAQIEAELSILSPRVAALESGDEGFQQRYSAAADGSLGLSPNLQVQGIGDSQLQIVRPTTTLILIGGLAGLLIWVLTQLVIITRRGDLYRQ